MSDEYAVLGLDLSLTATGICPHISDPEVDEPYTVKFGNRKFDPKGDKRLCWIRDAIQIEIDALFDTGDEYDLAVIEALPPYGKGSASLGLVHGVAREVLAHYNVPVIMVSPSPLKKFSTGSGKAGKGDMIKAFYAASPWQAGDFDDNAIDAWWLQQVGLVYLESDQAVQPFPEYDVVERIKKIK